MMILKEKVHLCENCKIGSKIYELDAHSEFCPYVICYEDDSCPFFRPIQLMGYTRKKSLLEKLIDFFKK